MNKKSILRIGMLVVISIFSYNASAEVFTLQSVKKDSPNAVTKIYKATGPVNVKYTYRLSAMYDEPSLYLTFDKTDTKIKDLLNFGADVDNIKSAVVKNSQMVSAGLPSQENCYYEGKAKVLLSEVRMFLPEESEVDTSVTISKILVASKPHLECYSSD